MNRIALLLIVSLPFIFTNLAQAKPTHLGQSISQHVTLQYKSDSENFCGNHLGFVRVLPDGSVETNLYTVPDKKILVITDVIWEADGGNVPLVQGWATVLTLNAHKQDGTKVGRVFRSTTVTTTADHVSGQFIGGNNQILAGVRIGSQRILCATANSSNSSGGATNRVRSVLIYGYQIGE